ncbi:MAG: hypothetical protein J2P41_06340 [Blastocatellia bacterium]|nr:hypothetical protein [Blastocatellia bacterium]
MKGIKIELNRKFSASSIANEGGGLEEDWLENLAFSVTNKTEKRITYLFISFQFPLFTENPHTQAGIYYQIILGVDPRATGTAGTYAEPFSLAAGDSHTIMLVDKDLNEIKKRLTMGKRSLADFNRMFILIPTVGYEDGTQWKLGKDSRPEKVQQSDDKEVEIASYDNEPYEINDLTVKNVKLHPGWSYSDPEESFVRRIKQSYKFSARSVAGDGGGREEDWLENLQFSVKNNSDKKVNYIGLSIQFPETTVNGPLMVDNSLNLGIRPSDSPEWASKKIPLSLGPADSVTLTLSAQNLKSIKDFLALRKFQLSGLNKAVIRMEEIYYLDDSIMWLTGSYYRPSTTTPGRYERIDK